MAFIYGLIFPKYRSVSKIRSATIIVYKGK
jgi:hypothetical protein